MSLPIYGIWTFMNRAAYIQESLFAIHGYQPYNSRAGNHACVCAIALVNGFNSANFIDISTLVVWTTYSCHQDGPWASYGYFAGSSSVLYWKMAESCIYTLLRAIFKKKQKISEKTQQIEAIQYNKVSYPIQ